MDFKQLEAFQALLKYGTCSRAAKSLLISQPTMTVRIQQLERELGIDLFKRTRGEFVPTAEGNFFADYVRDILRLQKESLKMINERKGLTSGSIKIGATSFGTYLLPQITKSFQDTYPGISLSISISNTSTVLENLLEEKLDLALVSSSIEKSGIYSIKVGSDSVVLVTTTGNSLSQKESITLKDLQHEQFIVREEGSDTRRLFDEWCLLNNFYPKNRIEISQPEAICRAITTNLGLSLISNFVLESDSRFSGFKRINVKGFPITRPIQILMLEKEKESIVKQAFIFFIKNHLNGQAAFFINNKED